MKNLRPPIVTILGHVDHGKTTLLDAIRKTNVAGKEAGGITQSIGASIVTTKEGRRITFIDTPGHAAFSRMRSRGAKVCDIALLIVASDDGVKPQTKEAIDIIREANIPFIVVLTKTDLPSSDCDSAISQLEKEGISFEGKGGDIPYLKVSAKKNEGLDELLEMVILIADVNEIVANPEGGLEAFVVETKKDKRGNLASIIVRDGSLEVGNKIMVDGSVTKVRGIFNYIDKPVRKILPGEPGLILGFETLPEVGAKVEDFRDESLNHYGKKNEKKPLDKGNIDGEKLNLVLKTQTSGSLEAVLSGLPADVGIISFGVGNVIEADIFTAKTSKNCRVFAFESKVAPNISKLADTEGVLIEKFSVIYKLFERVDEILKMGEEEILGEAEIVAVFPFENKKVAGCKVVKGKIGKNDILKIERKKSALGSVKAVSMRKEKKDISEAKQGEEFGVIFNPQLDFAIGDMLVSVRK